MTTTCLYVQFTNAIHTSSVTRTDVETIDEALVLADNPAHWPYNNTRVQVFEQMSDGVVREIDITRPAPPYSEAEIAPLREALAAADTVDPMVEVFGEPIDIITRTDLLEAGDLVEFSDDIKRDAGMPGSVAATRAVWADVVAWDESDNRRKGTAQDETGRAWDVLWMLSNAMRRFRPTDPTPVDGLRFCLVRVPRSGRGTRPRRVELKALFGVCDDGQTPAVTICMPDED